MPTIEINGCTIRYQSLGSGPPIVITAGGRSGMDSTLALAERLSSRNRVVIYDRRNCGASDVIIAGDLSEQEIWAEDLAELILKLGIGPAYVGGWSGGCRVSLLLAIRHPELVKGLLLGWITGGPVAAEKLAYEYYGKFVQIALKGGMAAVAATPFFSERIAQNPSNRRRLLLMEVQEFVHTMNRWGAFLTDGADQPVLGATSEQLGSIVAPAVVVSGDDETHTPAAAQRLHRLLKNSEFHEPVISRIEWERLSTRAKDERDRLRDERAGPILLEFVEKIEERQRAIGR